MSERSRYGEVWNHFEKNHTTKIAVCKYCKKSLSYKTTISNIKSHLRTQHIGVFISQNVPRASSRVNNSPGSTEVQADSQHSAVPVPVREEDEARSSSNNTFAASGSTDTENCVSVFEPRRKVQRVIHSYVRKTITPEEEKDIDLCVLELMTQDFQPFSIVEDKAFKKLLSKAIPGYKLPSRKTLANKLLPAEYAECLAKTKSLVLNNCESICLTVDCWSSRNMEAYMAVTGHFFDTSSLQFESVLIQCSAFEGSHTGSRIADELRIISEEWGITNKVNLLVSDNASNMLAAASKLGWNHFGCYAHKLNLIVQDALKIQTVCQTINKVQKTVGHFKRSSIAKERLLKYQNTAQEIAQPKSLLLSVPTRWNSTYNMLNRFILLQEAVRATVPNLNTALPIITLDEWNMIEQICDALQPFEEVTTIMSGEKYLCASKALVLTGGLKEQCDSFLSQDTICEPVKQLVTLLSKGLKERLGNIEKNESISICAILDPRFKQHGFEDESAVEVTKSVILEKLTNNCSDDDNSVRITQATDTGKKSLWRRFVVKANAAKSPKSAFTKCQDEINKYLSESVIPLSDCPIQWWRENKNMYPNMFKLFLKMSNIVVTSVPCERAFSKAGSIITDRRTRLETTKVAQLMFLHSNKTI
jgi:hypothetical protein